MVFVTTNRFSASRPFYANHATVAKRLYDIDQSHWGCQEGPR
jgi:hypothetical protein